MNKLLKTSGNEKWREFGEVDEEGLGEHLDNTERMLRHFSFRGAFAQLWRRGTPCCTLDLFQQAKK